MTPEVTRVTWEEEQGGTDLLQNFTNMLNNPQPKLAKFVKSAILEGFGHLEWYSDWAGGHPRNKVVQNFTNMLTCPTDYNNPQPKLAQFVKSAVLEGSGHLLSGIPIGQVDTQGTRWYRTLLICSPAQRIRAPPFQKLFRMGFRLA